MQKAIVTGANGFVGSAVCKELSDRGIKVTAVVRNEDSSIDRIKDIGNLNIVFCEMSEIERLPSITNEMYDVMYHFAWMGSAGHLRADYEVQLNNVKWTCDAVRTAKQLGCKRFVFAASIMEYEIQKLMQTNKNAGANTLYSASKITAEYMARIVANSCEIDYLGGVISNIYGPGEIGPRLINTTIRKMQNQEFCEFSPGEQIYDFIFIDDAAKAFVAIGEKGKKNTSYYIGSLFPKPLKEYLLDLRDVVSPGTEIGLGVLPFCGVSLSYKEFDIEALKKDTGFAPVVPFKEGIRLTADWLKEN